MLHQVRASSVSPTLSSDSVSAAFLGPGLAPATPGLGSETKLGGEDAALLAALRAGDRGAAAAFVRRFKGRMMSAAVRLLRDVNLAEDCVQDAFISAFRNLERFEGRASLATWLHRITVNACLVRLRTRKRAAECQLEAEDCDLGGAAGRWSPAWQEPASMEDLVTASQVRAFVRARIGELPQGYREILLLRDIEEKTTREVAALLRISEGAVKVRLHRARAALRRHIEPLPGSWRYWLSNLH